MPESRSIRILVTGQFDAWEFQQTLAEPMVGCEVTFLRWQDPWPSGGDFDFVIVCQARRGDFSDADASVLLHQFPLAQKVLLLASWCEGETRSGKPVAGIHRLFLRDWRFAGPLLLKEFLATGTSRLSRPVTESMSDFLMAAAPVPISSGRLNIALHAASPDCFATIREFCDDRQWIVQALEDCQKCDLVIVECYRSVQEALDLHPRIQSLGDLPLVVICGFPRPQDQQRLNNRYRAVRVVGKPFENGYLETAMLQLVRQGELKLVVDVA